MLCDALPKTSEQPGEARAGAALPEEVDRQPLTYQCVAAQPGRPQHSLAECERLSKSGTCVHVTPMWAEPPFPDAILSYHTLIAAQLAGLAETLSIT